jgi:hypothetical protein
MNVQEVINITYQRKHRMKVVMEKIMENVHKKIKYYAKHKKEGCSYVVPPLMDDVPIYDRVQVTKDIYKILNDEEINRNK